MHYWTESGRWWKPWTIAYGATIRYVIALAFPFWDGDAPGRAYTSVERDRFSV
jgi:hypothetical protein